MAKTGKPRQKVDRLTDEWRRAGMPIALPDRLAHRCRWESIGSLYQLLVARTPPSVHITYRCASCRHSFVGKRTEEVACCPLRNCQCHTLTAATTATPPELEINLATSSFEEVVNDVCHQLSPLLRVWHGVEWGHTNLLSYGFDAEGGCFVQIGFEGRPAGERTVQRTARMAVVAAAVNCPAVWAKLRHPSLPPLDPASPLWAAQLVR